LIPKGDPGISLLILLAFVLVFVVGSIAAAGIPMRKHKDYYPYRGNMFYKNLASASNFLFIVSILAYVWTGYAAGIGISSLAAGQLNEVKAVFYENYNIMSPFRIFFISGWILRIYLAAKGKRAGKVGLVLGIVAILLDATLTSARLTFLILAVGFVTLMYRKARPFQRVFLILVISAPLLVAVFALGSYLRDARVASGDLSFLITMFVGYFGTQYNYLPGILEYCSPVFAPQQLLLSPVLDVLPVELSQPLSPNSAEEVCNLPAFYNESFSPLSIPGDVYVFTGSITLVVLFVFFYGFVANMVYRLYRADNDYGLLLYPLIAATLLDSYRLPLIIQNLIFANIVALLIICFLSKRYTIRFSSTKRTG
jgi:hypothetical protein